MTVGPTASMTGIRYCHSDRAAAPTPSGVNMRKVLITIIGETHFLAYLQNLYANRRRVDVITMKTAIGITALVLYGFAIGVNAQGHGGGHGGGGHSGGGHSGGGHSGGGHASGGHSSGGSSGGRTGGAGLRSGSSGSGAHTSGTSGGRAIATVRANSARGASNATARGSNSARGTQIDDGVPPYSRPRDGRDPIGTAVPRTQVAQISPSTTILLPGTRSYPFGFYRPWAVGLGFGLYGFSPYDWGYVDPWYGPPIIGSSGGLAEDCEGALRLMIKPNDARVYVDGQYVGVVDDFDGIFQKLHVTCGPHRIEVQGDGYEPLVFDARITPGHKTTYQGVLNRIQ